MTVEITKLWLHHFLLRGCSDSLGVIPGKLTPGAVAKFCPTPRGLLGHEGGVRLALLFRQRNVAFGS